MATITTNDVRQVNRLLAAGESRRSIAERLGISRGSVDSIATGRRGETTKKQRCDEQLDSYKGPPMPRGRTYTRCPECGFKVLMPCYSCALRRAEQHKKLAATL